MSSIVAAAFLVMVILLCFNLMLFGASFLDNAAGQMALRNEMATEKGLESLIFIQTQIINNRLSITAFNDGSVSTHIVRVWWTNTSITPNVHGGADLNFWLDPGSTLNGIGGPQAGNFNATKSYTFNLVTARGNIFQTKYSPISSFVLTMQGFGWIGIDWSSYHYNYSTGGPVQGPFEGWCLTESTATFQFGLTAINHFNQSLTLLSWSFLKFVSNTGGDIGFFIMRRDSTAQHPLAYSSSSPVILPANPNPLDTQTGGTPTPLKFLASTAGGTNLPSGLNNAGYYSVIIVLFYQYTDALNVVHTYGQTIAYEATQVIGSSC